MNPFSINTLINALKLILTLPLLFLLANCGQPMSSVQGTLDSSNHNQTIVGSLESSSPFDDESTAINNNQKILPTTTNVKFKSTEHLKNNLLFIEEFEQPGFVLETDTSKNFRLETMADPLHRTGNQKMDRNGKPTKKDYGSAVGKRWSAWYDKHHNKTTYNENGYLVMQGHLSNEADPTRKHTYTQNGRTVNFGQSKIYTSWIDTWTKTWSEEHKSEITDFDSPNKVFKYGYFEVKVNFEEMKTPGFRLSAWLMPAYTDSQGLKLVENTAYNDKGADGVEIDIFEYEFNEGHFKNSIVMAIHGGGAGSSNTIVDAGKFNINLLEGEHIISLLWEADKITWFIDGQIVKTVTDKSIIPAVYSYLIISREANSGVKDDAQDGAIKTLAPYRPSDPGLYGENILLFKDRISSDKAKVDFIKVWGL